MIVKILFFAIGLAQPPSPASQFQKCASCHRAATDTFRATGHGKAADHKLNGMIAPCSVCHQGDLEKHSETKDIKYVGNPARLQPALATESCLSCHAMDYQRQYWRGSPHE